MTSSLTLGDLAFGCALLFLCGLFTMGIGWHFYILFSAAVTGIAIGLLFARRRWRECMIFFIFILCGAFYYHFYFRARTMARVIPFGVHVSFRAVVIDEPQFSDKYLILLVHAQPPLKGTIRMLVSPESIFAYGDLIQASGMVNAPKTLVDDPIIFSPGVTLIARHHGFFLREWMINVKRAVMRRFGALLPADQAALLGGIAFGSKQNFDQSLKAAMAASGLTHLVAVSGYNVTIVIFAVKQAFGRWLPRRVTFFIGVFFLILFMFMVGGAASGVRAAIMGFLALIAREAGRSFDMRNAVVITAAAMSLFEPSALTSNMSFVLSFASLLGIVYLSDPLRDWLCIDQPGFFDWRENAITTSAAQLAVLPILVRVFGQFSATAIVANILVLGTVPLTMFVGLLLAFFSLASLSGAFFAAKVAGLLLGYQLFIIRLFARLAVPLPLPFWSNIFMIFYYATLVMFTFRHARLRRRF